MSNLAITIDRKAHQQIMWYVNKCDKEISGLGRIIRTKDGLHVNKIYLLEQECTAVETELDGTAVAKLLYESRLDEGSMMFWWHSHVNMACNWSGTDYECMKQLGGNGMILSTVFNKKGESRTALYVKGDDLRPDMYQDDLKFNVASPFDKEEVDFLEKEYKDKVKFPTTNHGNRWTYGKKWCTATFTWLDDPAVDTSNVTSITKSAAKPNSVATELEKEYAKIEKRWNKLSNANKTRVMSAYYTMYEEIQSIEYPYQLDFAVNSKYKHDILWSMSVYDFNMKEINKDIIQMGHVPL